MVDIGQPAREPRAKTWAHPPGSAGAQALPEQPDPRDPRPDAGEARRAGGPVGSIDARCRGGGSGVTREAALQGRASSCR